MLKLWKVSFLSMICLLIVAVSFAFGADKTVIRLAHEDPPDDQWGQGAIHFKELVEKKSNGKVEIQIFDNGQLGHGLENIEQLQSGTLQMTLGGSDIVL